MKANSITLHDIFGSDIRYIVPLFQRPYVWNKNNNWQPLWEDIIYLAEQYLENNDDINPHFIGAIVIEPDFVQSGHIISKQIIDGQQRLTTIQLLLKALKDLSSYYDLEIYSKRFNKYIKNDESFVNNADEKYKVLPTNRDREDYNLIMQTQGPDELIEVQNKLIPNAYLYFYNVTKTWIDDNDESSEILIAAIFNVLQKKLLLVGIDLEANDDPQVIFESMNSRGTNLLPADLIKNYLFRRAEVDKISIDDLYDKYWKEFDNDYWRENITQGRSKIPRINLFIQHFIALKTLKDVSVTRIFELFKQYEMNSGLTPSEQLHELNFYGKIFMTIFNPPENTHAKIFLNRLYIIDTTTIYPFLMKLFEVLPPNEDAPELIQILIDIESYLVRRMFCRDTTKNYNKFFLELVKLISNTERIEPEIIREYLLKQDSATTHWPSDKKLLELWIDVSFYGRLNQKKQRLILEALDLNMNDSRSESVYIQENLSIEHLMPQNWQEHWPINETDTIKLISLTEKRNQLIHTIGNLTLVTQRLNSSIVNRDWDTKKPAILLHSRLNMNRRFHNVHIWNENSITERSYELFNIAKKIWPYPKQIESTDKELKEEMK